jgi:hypothetical protein
MATLPTLVGSLLTWGLEAEELEKAWITIHACCYWFVMSYTFAASCLFLSAACCVFATTLHFDWEQD